MIIYFLMVAYVFLMGVAAKQQVISGATVSKYNNYTNLAFAILIFALPVFFIGFRSYIGDTSAYIASYEALSPGFPVLKDDIFKTRGYGWSVYQYLIKYVLQLNTDWFLMFTAMFQAGALIKLYYKYSTDYPLSSLLFFLSVSFMQMLNGLRQFFAICLILYFVDWIFKKKYIRFLIVVFIAISIHNVAIVWLAAVFLIQGRPANIRMLIFSFLIILAITFVDQFTNLLEDGISETSYAGYTNQFNNDSGSNISHTLVSAVPLVIAFIGRKKIRESGNNVTNVLVNISILETMISLLGNFTSGILIGRMPGCFSAFGYVLLPRLFQQAFNEKDAMTMRVLCILGFSAYFLYYMFYMKPNYNSALLGLNIG